MPPLPLRRDAAMMMLECLDACQSHDVYLLLLITPRCHATPCLRDATRHADAAIEMLMLPRC